MIKKKVKAMVKTSLPELSTNDHSLNAFIWQFFFNSKVKAHKLIHMRDIIQYESLMYIYSRFFQINSLVSINFFHLYVFQWKKKVISSKFGFVKKILRPKLQFKQNLINTKINFKRNLFNAKRRLIQPLINKKINFFTNLLQHKISFLRNIFGWILYIDMWKVLLS